MVDVARHRDIGDVNKRHFDSIFADPAQAYRLHAQGLLTYSAQEGRWLARRTRRLTGLALPPGARVLELGGGSGYASINLARGVPEARVTLLDIAYGGVQLSLRQCAEQRVAGNGVQANAMTLPFKDQSFDVVVGRALMHHIPDLEMLLAESWRVIKPGGWALFFGEPAVPGSDRFRAFKRAYRALVHRGRPVGSGQDETPRYARAADDLRTAMRRLRVDGDIIETGVAFQYVGALWYPVLLKLKSPRVARAVNQLLRPLTWVDDALLRHLLPRWTCEQRVVLQRRAA